MIGRLIDRLGRPPPLLVVLCAHVWNPSPPPLPTNPKPKPTKMNPQKQKQVRADGGGLLALLLGEPHRLPARHHRLRLLRCALYLCFWGWWSSLLVWPWGMVDALSCLAMSCKTRHTHPPVVIVVAPTVVAPTHTTTPHQPTPTQTPTTTNNKQTRLRRPEPHRGGRGPVGAPLVRVRGRGGRAGPAGKDCVRRRQPRDRGVRGEGGGRVGDLG